MNRTRTIFFVIIAIVLGGVWLLSDSLVEPPQQQASKPVPKAQPAMPADSIELSIASSSTKQAWMEAVAANFANSGQTTRSGKKIVVRVNPVSSGGSTKAILEGRLKPTVWSPGSRSWVSQLSDSLRQQGQATIMSKQCQASIYTPLGIAMWRPMAEALGWPDKPIGWKTIVELASDDTGWARHGHPEWGKFRFGHAHPKYGNSGLLTMTSFVYGIAGKGDITPRQAYTPAVKNALKTLAQNTSKYGVVTEDLVKLMVNEGPRYLHAIATYEAEAVNMNLKYTKQLRFPVAFIFPAEGAFWGDHPYCVLDQANWVSPEQAEAAQLFYDFMNSGEQQKLAIDKRLRPLDTNIALHAPLDLEHGTNPAVTPETVAPLPEPSGEMGQAVIDVFLQTKRKASVIMALDVSGSMNGEKIRSATEASAKFLKRLHPDDRIGVLTFNTDVTTLQAPARVADNVEQLANTVQNLLVNGNTALHKAVCQATAMLQQQRKRDQKTGDSRLYGVILLSDGDDTVGQPSENEMFATCLPAHAEADGVKIYPIAFGEGANQTVLQRIAQVSGGKMFAASPQSLEKIYLKISAEQ
ncbi:vWA domain-containing protein [Candidatus Venteria ishoeyi]|uniref:von Willebrand factor type A domain protein n=1 Tax=Candidatus Venteria ishoeyi TaxID=1899563 RepID=A0A1H6F4B9_9GAMM|nr:VWA domain-containing protein [Candidatus Venteria ishoeyi]MDM8545812.1 VWA domain-containing protein [Candidatus Venteria ishoeyi]SEH04970.1 von Willebrand factor type A domain protein [Candidatus Venteria ishoeyi]